MADELSRDHRNNTMSLSGKLQPHTGVAGLKFQHWCPRHHDLHSPTLCNQGVKFLQCRTQPYMNIDKPMIRADVSSHSLQFMKRK